MKADGKDMKMRSLGDVANCATWVYSPIRVKREGGKSWANIEDRQYINAFRFKTTKFTL